MEFLRMCKDPEQPSGNRERVRGRKWRGKHHRDR
jgi:hypothetical protein